MEVQKGKTWLTQIVKKLDRILSSPVSALVENSASR
jgi:hypothetical protein